MEREKWRKNRLNSLPSKWTAVLSAKVKPIKFTALFFLLGKGSKTKAD